MKSLSESPAILTVHAGPAGQYILRVGDLRYRPLIVGVTRLLPDASSLVVITPSDIKVYAVNNGTQPVEESHEAVEDSTPLDSETQAAIDSEEQRSVPGAVQERNEEVGAVGEGTPEVVGETPQGTKVVRRRKSSTPAAGHDDQCQRCAGAGRIKIMLDGGAATDTACPICQGTGVMRRYGGRR